jgi:hypothetical protein
MPGYNGTSDTQWALRDAGAEIIAPADLARSAEIIEPGFAVLCHEFKHDLNAYLAKLGPASRVAWPR